MSGIGITGLVNQASSYWQKKLVKSTRGTTLHLDKSRPPWRSAHDRSAEFSLDGGTYRKLVALTNDEPFLIFAALVACVDTCLLRYSGSRRVNIGCPMTATDSANSNPVVISSDIDEDMPFRDVLFSCRRDLAEAELEQNYPFEKLLQDFEISVAKNRCPLFDISLELRGLHQPMADVGQDVALTFEQRPEQIHITATFSNALFSDSTVERFLRHLCRVLESGVNDPNVPVGELRMLDADEEREFLVERNRTSAEYPKSCIHQLFEKRVALHPTALAVACGEAKLSFAELDRRAEMVAYQLRTLGVAGNDLVGLFMNRSVDLPVGLLGILKSGATYVPLDPTYPRDRLAKMLVGAQLKVLLTSEHLAALLPPEIAPKILHIEGLADSAGVELCPRSPSVDLANNCYGIFTSGSTGEPKLVGVQHRGWTNLIWWFVNTFEITSSDRTLIISSISFDITQRGIAIPLITGGQLHFVDSDDFDPDLILKTIDEQKITVVHCAPSSFYNLLDQDARSGFARLASLKKVFLGGEAISPSRLLEWITSPGCGASLVNVYGAAECTDVSTFYRLHDLPLYLQNGVPIGRPISNVSVYVLDKLMRPVPVGVQGEIYISGIGVGSGYLNDQNLSKQRFLKNEVAPNAGDKLYRTGDLGCLLSDGNIEFAGRADHQIKIRGQRVELGDIEHAIRQQPGIKDAAVVPWQHGPDDRRIAAYVVLDPDYVADATFFDVLREGVQESLPDYMVPNSFHLISKIPLNPNGKLERSALPLPNRTNTPQSCTPPRTSLTQERVARIFSHVLDIPRINPDAGFFSLGGHSLLATKVISQIAEAFNVRFTRAEFFAKPTIAGVTCVIEEKLGSSGSAQA